MIARRPDHTRSAFRRHYEDLHVPLALPSLHGLERYVRNHLRSSLDDGEPGFDVLTEFSYASAEALSRVVTALEGPEGDAIRQDELSFMDKARNRFVAVQPLDGAPLGAAPGPEAHKVAWLAARPPGAEAAAFTEHCLEASQPILDAALAFEALEALPARDGAVIDFAAFAWLPTDDAVAVLRSWQPDAALAWRLVVDDARTAL